LTRTIGSRALLEYELAAGVGVVVHDDADEPPVDQARQPFLAFAEG
jgi:hypothetical protein